ncbi:MAG: hypothetical protein ACOYOS_04945, partial [Syntrophales bacterium]
MTSKKNDIQQQGGRLSRSDVRLLAFLERADPAKSGAERVACRLNQHINKLSRLQACIGLLHTAAVA